MNAAELKQRGYAHLRAGTIDPELAREDSPAGRAYRDGIRQARRDAEDGAGDHCEDCDPAFGCWNGTDATCRKPTPREAKEAAANPEQASSREQSTSAEQPPPRPPKANAFFEPPTKPAKRAKKKPDAEQLDLL